jgi:hypothetical protein
MQVQTTCGDYLTIHQILSSPMAVGHEGGLPSFISQGALKACPACRLHSQAAQYQVPPNVSDLDSQPFPHL